MTGMILKCVVYFLVPALGMPFLTFVGYSLVYGPRETCRLIRDGVKR